MVTKKSTSIAFPRVGFVCDGLHGSGMGHLMRCSALSRELGKAGGQCVFGLLKGSDAELARVSGVSPIVFEVGEEEPAVLVSHILGALGKPLDMVVVDTYRLGPEFYKILHETRPQLAVFGFDDFGEKMGLPLLGLVNAGLAGESLSYPGRFVLYSALGPEFACLPESCTALPRRDPSNCRSVDRVLLAMGAADPERQTLRLARILDTMGLEAQVEIVLGPTYGEMEAGLTRLSPRFTIHKAPKAFHRLASRCDVAVTGGGGTCLELMCLGVPIAVLSLADNQDPTVQALQEKEIGYPLGRFDSVTDEEIRKRLEAMLAGTEEMRERAVRGATVVDGYGGARLAAKLIAAWRLYTGSGFSVAQVADEYLAASDRPDNYQKALWGSAEGMRNRFLLSLEMLGKGPVTSWLDIGCGPGDFQHEAADAFVVGRFVGLDMCGKTLGEARRNPMSDLDAVYLEQDFMGPVPDEPFSLVTALGVLHKCGHSLMKSVARLADLVAPGGRLLVTTKNLGWRAFNTPGCVPYEGHAWFLPEQVAESMRDNGFGKIEIRGFEPRSGRWVPLGEAHSMMIAATREGR